MVARWTFDGLPARYQTFECIYGAESDDQAHESLLPTKYSAVEQTTHRLDGWPSARQYPRSRPTGSLSILQKAAISDSGVTSIRVCAMVGI